MSTVMQDVHRGVTVDFRFDGSAYTALAGQSVAAALFASGVKVLRASPRAQQPRGMFCLMGSCQECLVMVDGRRVLACQTPVTQGLSISVVPQAHAHD